jgi:RNA polymerase sigma-70 factor, ECF subfamily
VGRHAPVGAGRVGGGPPAPAAGRRGLTADYAGIFREHWRAAVAVAARLSGDLDTAEDAAQEACALALEKWPACGMPDNPGPWLVGVARHKALDRLRRESLRAAKEAAAALEPGTAADADADDTDADELGLIFMCCHPALDPAARVALTMRCVCGVATPDIAAAFLVPEPTMAQRIVRAKRKIRAAGIRMTVPAPDELPGRLAAVIRVIYLVFNAGYLAPSGPALIRRELCDQAVSLARAVASLLPGEPEALGLLALLLLTDARRDARVADSGELVVLADQDRSKWNRAQIAEGERLLEQALRAGRPGPYQLHAAIAAGHSCADSAEATDWRQIAALYGALLRYEPTAVTEANRAVAVAMAEGPARGLAVLDALGADPQLTRWPQFHIARAELLALAGRRTEAAEAYGAALGLAMPAPERAHIERRRAEAVGHHNPA